MDNRLRNVEALLRSRQGLVAGEHDRPRTADAAEGGCGVLGLASSDRIAGRHLITASQQMHNRGNGKGGGLAAAGLDPDQMRVTPDVLRTHSLIQIAYLDRGARGAVEHECIDSQFDCAARYVVDTVGDWREIPGLDVEPPEVVRYFCRVRPEVLSRFAEQNGLRHLPARRVEDEFVYQNTFRLNQRYYASLGHKRAFVLCHGRDLLVFKIVGYAEQAASYYRLEDLRAHVWISHQRYPTKGRVWHPAGAHPFIGVNEALVHNGDFANYHRVGEYLRQRNIVPLFLTDTEVSALLFDLWDRVYAYPLEVVLEALAPTSERDFDMLPEDTRALYSAVQQVHLHGSPDGPWLFIIARSRPDAGEWQLLGITDTSMLRPQVFALYEGGGEADRVRIGLIASERQAINACLRSLSDEDGRFQPLADRYWVARGGSYTDGGAFTFTASRTDKGADLVCRNKFGVEVGYGQPPSGDVAPAIVQTPGGAIGAPDGRPEDWFTASLPALTTASLAALEGWLAQRVQEGRDAGEDRRAVNLAALTLLRDRRFDVGAKKRSAVVAAVDRAIHATLRDVPALEGSRPSPLRRLDAASAGALRAPAPIEATLVIDGRAFEPEGERSAADLLRRAHGLGWRRFVVFDCRGGRFLGCGLAHCSEEVRIDVFGDPGDYLASGLQGPTVVVHGDAQDQLGQILKEGRLVVHGDVGQTFLYGAKGGSVFVLGSAAGRPLINAVGRPRAVINGTCLDYLAESFMAGDPLHGGGFVVLNGVRFDDDGQIRELETPYPGSNLFSLASGGAIYLRDPRGAVDVSQLNGGRFAPLENRDWALIEPYLKENDAAFGIPIERLLTFEGHQLPPERVYRKVEVLTLQVLH
jgi:glutamate synthase domain-containing protein 1/glutamate synthase domain-containing protein 3